ncbi:MAG: signal peptidase I [Pirellulales bacterium]
MSTTIFLLIFLGLMFLAIVFWGVFLRMGLNWAKVPDVNFSRIVWATAIVSAFGIAMNMFSASINRSLGSESIVFGLASSAIAVAAQIGLIAFIFKTSVYQAFKAWLPTLILALGLYGIASLVIRPHIFETFSITSNAMAPTLLGQHWEGTCPECGSKCFCTPNPQFYKSPIPRMMICENFHVSESNDSSDTVHSADRIMVAKYLFPKRWDLAVFHYPGKPSEVFVKRLVGLPGEQVQIKDGAVWINGKRQTPPDSINGVEYLSELPYMKTPIWGSQDRPVVLGKDEYFVLGDFSAQSMDSRLWQQGAEGYPPYVVPKSYMVGVATHTIWPSHRIRIHR